MKCIDELLSGNITKKQLNFNSCHFSYRLKQNRISLEFVEHLLLNVNPRSCDMANKNNSFELLYDAPESKYYNEIKIVVYDCSTHLNVSTVMFPNESKSKRHNDFEKSDNLKRKHHAIGKAFHCN